MIKTDIIILTEGGQQNGFGHIIRCLSLLQAFSTYHISAKIIINGAKKECFWITDKGIILFDWLNRLSSLKEQLQSAKLIIIDSYKASAEIYQELSALNNLVCIDDNCRLQYPTEAIILNGSIYANQFSYPQNLTLVGEKYALLRKEFWHIPKKLIRNEISNILVTFGGGDFRNMTQKVLNDLIIHFPNVGKTVITTDAFPNLEAISSQADKHTTIIKSPTAKQMIASMIDCDIAVSSGGQTLYELACVGTPTITVTEIENQILNVKYLSENHVIVSAGAWNDQKRLETITTQIHNMRSKIKRMRHSELGQRTIDGRGSLRVAQFLQECVQL